MKRLLILVLLGVACSAAAAATPPQLTDFARMLPLTLGGSGPLHELPLPAEVYRGVTRADLGDLAVFDRSGELVPFTLLGSAPGKGVVEEKPLPLFPLAGGGQRLPGDLTLQVRTDAQGASVALQATPAGVAAEPVSAYVVDSRSLGRPVSGFDLELQPTGKPFLGTVRVETSDDLRLWREHAIGALAALHAGERELNRSRVEFPAVVAPYFRLTLSPVAAAPVVAAVTARLATVAAVPRDQRRFPLAPVQGEVGAYLVRTDGPLPVDRVRLVFAADNSLAGVTILSRPERTTPWVVRGCGTCYRLRRGETVIESPPLELAPTTDRQWLVRLRHPGSGLGADLPLLEVGWQPARLVFAARGQPPYRLAFGSARIGDASLRDEGIAGVLATWERQQLKPLAATAGKSLEAGGRRALRQPLPAATWKRGLLWGALAAGVLLLARMAWQLAREMKMTDNGTHPPQGGVAGGEAGRGNGS